LFLLGEPPIVVEESTMIALQRYLNRMTVTDRGEQIAIFAVGVIVGIGLCICLLLIP
jgi:hypothetical protein